MEANTQAIVLMAWARSLGLPDDALSDEGELVLDARSEDDAISVLSVLGRTVVSGPDWACERAADYSVEALTTAAGLLALAKDRVPRVVRDDTLYYADDYPTATDGHRTLTTDPAAYDELRATCTPDDIAHSGLDDIADRIVLLDEDERPIAAGGWTVWEGVIADLALVASVDTRDAPGHLPVASFVVGEVLDHGLVPQLRVGHDDTDAAALADALGLYRAGTHLVVALG